MLIKVNRVQKTVIDLYNNRYYNKLKNGEK